MINNENEASPRMICVRVRMGCRIIYVAALNRETPATLSGSGLECGEEGSVWLLLCLNPFDETAVEVQLSGGIGEFDGGLLVHNAM